jgi:hypothetical protein
MSYEIIRKNFLRKLWTYQMVKKAVGVVITEDELKNIMNDGVNDNIITAKQYQEITGEEYTA